MVQPHKQHHQQGHPRNQPQILVIQRKYTAEHVAGHVHVEIPAHGKKKRGQRRTAGHNDGNGKLCIGFVGPPQLLNGKGSQ
ncbi:hypothetical protein D3C75_809990 [compost metagenome]